MLLRDAGTAVVAIDDREEGENVGQARELGLPVVIGRGADPSLLRRLSLDRALALAAVTDDDLQNITVAMAARAKSRRPAHRPARGRRAPADETRSLVHGSATCATCTASARSLLAAQGDRL